MEQGNKPVPEHGSRSDTTPPSTHGQSADPVRFVVLLHRQREGSHFDLMIENGPTLAAWKMDTAPEHASAEGIPCTRIAEHRRRYLSYEGPISGDRGHVSRLDEGTCRVQQRSDAAWRVAFNGKRIEGVFLLDKAIHQGEAWRLRPLLP